MRQKEWAGHQASHDAIIDTRRAFGQRYDRFGKVGRVVPRECERGMSRSGFLAEGARELMRQESGKNVSQLTKEDSP